MTKQQVCSVIIAAVFGCIICVLYVTGDKALVPQHKTLGIGNTLDRAVYNLTTLLVSTGYDPHARLASKSTSYKTYKNGGIITVQYYHSIYTHKDGCIQQGYSYTIEAAVDLNGNIIKIISQVK